MQDIHTHLYWESYDADRDVVVARAREAGVQEMFVVGCTVEESKQAIKVTERYKDMYATVAIHPHEFNKGLSWSAERLSESIEVLRGLVKGSKRVIAIGECGLDYYSHDQMKAITPEQKTTQKEGFLAQIALAQELALPMILHCRPSVGTMDSYEEMFQILQDPKLAPRTSHLILHCYMGDTAVTERFLEMSNVYFSFTGNITYPVKKTLVGTKDDLTETVRMVPLERLFVETDCPFLAPQAHRGERNEPAYVTEVAECLARLHGTDIPLVTAKIKENFERIFPMIQ